jgi:hypothetical protein
MRTCAGWVFLICSWALLASEAGARPAEVILFRHAEKPADPNDVHLARLGEERAEMLARYLTSAPALTNAGLPGVLFATAWTKHYHSRRPFETLEPLARKLQLTIQQPFLAEQYAQLARDILENPAYDGKVVVVCWVHEELPELAHALGVRPKPSSWKAQVYDRIWKITWTKHRTRLHELRQPAVDDP